MSDRGMKKWAPYSSLIEQATCLEKMRYERNKVEKPKIANDQAEKFNYILKSYHGQILRIRFWHDGYFYIIEKPIKRIDLENKKLIFDNGKLPFNLIIEIEDLSGF